jgi:RNA polymerase sigma-70 factor (ECF subfamily)
VHGAAAVHDPDLAGQRKVVDAFLAAMRNGEIEGLDTVLDPDVVVRAESAEGVREIRGTRNWARGAVAFAQHARSMQPEVVDGTVGIIMAPGGRLRAVRFTFANGKIIEADVIMPSQARPGSAQRLKSTWTWLSPPASCNQRVAYYPGPCYYAT